MSTGLPPFFVKGSYVLDVVFARTKARDIDIYFSRSHRQPSSAEVLAWAQQHSFPTPRTVDFTPSDDIDDCSGGGPSVFNVDLWHLREDGALYVLEETSQPRQDLAGLWGLPAVHWRRAPLSRRQARATRMHALQSLTTIARDREGLDYVSKALRKMRDHPELWEDELEKQLVEFEDRLHQELSDEE
jgi:hypothetical protein